MLLMGLPCLGVKSFLFHGTGVKVSFPSVLYLQFTILSFYEDFKISGDQIFRKLFQIVYDETG